MNTATFKVEGMHCNGCAQIVRSLLEKKTGVRAAHVSFTDGATRILHDPESITEDQLAEAIEKAGYHVVGKT